jgi:hypothetical protein
LDSLDIICYFILFAGIRKWTRLALCRNGGNSGVMAGILAWQPVYHPFGIANFCKLDDDCIALLVAEIFTKSRRFEMAALLKLCGVGFSVVIYFTLACARR